MYEYHFLLSVSVCVCVSKCFHWWASDLSKLLCIFHDVSWENLAVSVHTLVEHSWKHTEEHRKQTCHNDTFLASPKASSSPVTWSSSSIANYTSILRLFVYKHLINIKVLSHSCVWLCDLNNIHRYSYVQQTHLCMFGYIRR